MFYNTEITLESVNESNNNEDTIVLLEEKRKRLAEHSRQLLQKQLKSISDTFKRYH